MKLVVWDTQMLTKEYVGEVSLPLEDWFCDKDKDGKDKEKTYGFDQPSNEACILIYAVQHEYLSHPLAVLSRPHFYTSQHSVNRQHSSQTRIHACPQH